MVLCNSYNRLIELLSRRRCAEEIVLKFLLAFVLLITTWSTAYAEKATFTFLKTLTVTELNVMLSTERDGFLQSATAGNGYQLPPSSTASNDVDIYIVRYWSRSPDLGKGRRTMVSGMLAMPRLSNISSIPLLSYQHGTVWGKYEVPSYAFKEANPIGYQHYPNAYETRYMVALFAGNGYAVMAADYFGMGDASRDNEAYMIKRSTAQVNYDLYLDVRKYLASRSISASKFFLGGWSQGGINTTGFLELLENRGVTVNATFTASSPSDPFAALNGIFYHPRSRDASWLNTLVALTIFSCEKYMGSNGLARATINPNYFQGFKSIYERTAYPEGFHSLLKQWEGTPNVNYLRPEFRDPAFFANSAYGKCLAANETYRQEFRTPIRMFYGSNDEVIRERIALLGSDYQETLVDTPYTPSSNTITPILVNGADHRFTFISAAPLAKAWMDNLP